MVAQNTATSRVWEYRRAGEPEQTPEWREMAQWLSRVLGTAHSARYLAEVEPGVELFSVSAGESAPHGERRLVWHVSASGRLWCESCRGVGCAHVGAVILHRKLHGDQRVAHHEPTAEELEASTQVWREASGW